MFKFKIPKQKTDGGRLGGIYTIFQQSQGIFAIVNFAQITMVTYVMIFKQYLPIPLFAIIYILGFSAWIMYYYTRVFPSSIVFSNNQAFNPERNPICRDLETIKKDLEILKKRRHGLRRR